MAIRIDGRLRAGPATRDRRLRTKSLGLGRPVLLAALVALTGIASAAEIHDAVRTGDLARVRALVEGDARAVDGPDEEGDRPLHVAVWEERPEIAVYLLESGAHPDAPNAADQTPLFYVGFKGPPDLAERLLAKGADPRRRDRYGRTALHYAAREGQFTVAESLIRHGAEIGAKDGQGDTPLSLAAARGWLAIAEILLARGADLNTQSRWRATPLLNAVRGNAPEVAAFLLGRGADPGIGGHLGLTPLQAAARDGRVPLADLLIRGGAAVEGEDEGGSTALHWAAARGHGGMAAFLLGKGADPDHANAVGRTPLHVAAASGYRSIVETLLMAGADPGARDDDGDTPLDDAAAHGNLSAHDLLKQRGTKGGSRRRPADSSALLKRKPRAGTAVTWYLNHSGWAVRTRNHLLIFDYWDPTSDPDEPGLANGRVTLEELRGLKTLVLVSHEHHDHFDEKILRWAEAGADVTYVYGWPRDARPGSISFSGSLQTVRVGEATVTNLRCADGGSAFLVAVDGLVLYHSGDYTGEYRRDLASLAEKAGTVDLAFIETSPVYEEITLHALERLRPRVMFPMHAGGAENWYRTWASRWSGRFPQTSLVAAGQRGDRWKYRRGIRALP